MQWAYKQDEARRWPASQRARKLLLASKASCCLSRCSASSRSNRAYSNTCEKVYSGHRSSLLFWRRIDAHLVTGKSVETLAVTVT